jgi:CubicO group peptidase (beta-lactamase class C family)
MLKKLLSIILAFSVILGMSTLSSEASQPQPTVELNGTALELEDEIYTNEEGKIMVPLRNIFEELDYEVKWNGKEEKIKISNDSEDIELGIGDSDTILKKARTFMPLEFLSNRTNLVLGLDNNEQIIKINTPKQNVEGYFEMTRDANIKTELNDYMKSLEENQNFYGSVLIAKDGKVLLNNGYGFADLNQKTKNKSGTKFAIGSVTKQFTAIGIMQLVEKGLIKVEDKISKYIPSAPHGDKITIHNLLTHTSGLVNYTNLNEFLTGNIKNKTPIELIEIIKDLPLEFQPGERFEYNNTGYLLLGMIIENVSEKPFGDYLKENIFNALNMADTGISYGENNETHDSTPYVGHLEVQPVDEKILLSQAYGAGNIYSTVGDLYRWDRALNTEKLVKKETLDEIFKEHTPITEEASYGYGWMIEDAENGRVVYHGGNTLGHSSNIARYIDQDLTIIVLTNKGIYDVEKLTNILTSIALGKEYERPEKVGEIEDFDFSIYDEYVGDYELVPGLIITITREDESLYAQLTGQEKAEIFPKSENKFFYKIVDAEITFIKEDEKVTQLILHQLGQELPGIKIK